MAAQLKCHCQSCTIRGLVGPAVVITVGVLWLLDQMHGGRLYFGSTWPVILIVIGLLHLAGSMASREGHVTAPQQGAPPSPPAPPSPDAGTPQTPYSSQGQ
jgi:Domain of unknown function (DUF5668)